MATKKTVIKKDNITQAIAIKIANHLLTTGATITVAELSAMFGEVAGASPTALVQIASSNYTPSLQVAINLARFLETEVEELFDVTVEVND